MFVLCKSGDVVTVIGKAVDIHGVQELKPATYDARASLDDLVCCIDVEPALVEQDVVIGAKAQHVVGGVGATVFPPRGRMWAPSAYAPASTSSRTPQNWHV